MLSGFPWLSDYFVMPPIKACALGICELSRKVIDPNALISRRLSVLRDGTFVNMFWYMWKASPALRRSLHYTTDEPRALLFRAHHNMLMYVDNIACTGLDSKQVQLQTDRIAETALAAGLADHPVTTARSRDESSSDGIHGCVSVNIRRIRMMRLRNAL